MANTWIRVLERIAAQFGCEVEPGVAEALVRLFGSKAALYADYLSDCALRFFGV